MDAIIHRCALKDGVHQVVSLLILKDARAFGLVQSAARLARRTSDGDRSNKGLVLAVAALRDAIRHRCALKDGVHQVVSLLILKDARAFGLVKLAAGLARRTSDGGGPEECLGSPSHLKSQYT